MLTCATALAAPGDVYTTDREADTVWKLGRGGGEASPLSADPAFVSPYGMTLGPDGYLYVADEAGKIFKVNRRTGAVVEVAAVGSNPTDVAFDARGRLLAVDYNADDILLVNRRTGTGTTLYDGPDTGFNSIAIRRNGVIFISDENDDKVYRLRNGVLTPIIQNDPELTGLDGIMLSPDERYLYVGSFDVPRFARYDLRTGQILKFGIGVKPYSLALLPSNRLIFSETDTGDLLTVGRLGGATRTFSADSDLDQPRDIVVEPLRCGGRFPTIVGTNRRDVIRGSRFRDVISTLGGNDVVYGLGGADIICGGKGNDRLLGGRGNDRVLGKNGRDRLLGQLGNDSLFGGGGGDRAFGGNGRDRLYGQGARDFLFGNRGPDRLFGGPGSDLCRGGPGNDRYRTC